MEFIQPFPNKLICPETLRRLAVFFAINQTRLFKSAQMLRKRWKRYIKRIRKFSWRLTLVWRQTRQNTAASRIAQRKKELIRLVHSINTVNHAVHSIKLPIEVNRILDFFSHFPLGERTAEHK